MQQDTIYIKETFRLAKKALGKTFPNPMVGAVIVKNGVVIAKGYHRKAGQPHAEIDALSQAGKKTKGTTMYINLEPCCHYGKTPPCVKEIIQKGIKRVVCAALDPNPKVNGKGVRELQKAGIDVTTNILDHEARILNEQFFVFHEKKRPFIALKFAASMDGKIATKEYDSTWITNEKARSFARKLRSNFQATLVGVNTVIHDNPSLGTNTKDPLRIVLDTGLRIPLTSNVLRDSNILIATTENANRQKKEQLEKRGVELIILKGEKISLLELLKKLADREVISIFVEGGSQTLGSFADEKLVDKVYAFHAPLLIGGKNAVSAIGGNGPKKLKEAIRLKTVQRQSFADNMLTIGYV